MQIALVDIIFWIAVAGAVLYIPALFALMVGYAIWDARDSKRKIHHIYGFPPPGSVIQVAVTRKSTGEDPRGDQPRQQVDET